MPITTPAQLDLARRVSEHVHAHPEQHDQTIFYRDDAGSCGTAGCIAGWTAVLDGARPIFAELGSCLAFEVSTPGGDRLIAEYARKALGLTADEARRLFTPNQTDSSARDYLDELIEDAGWCGGAAVSGGVRA
ncbi:hypothetical protein [Nocardia brasiliensis]|uniref:hypothetical protein n=1 Tax=Nocardia brasiliensis TaxID=37326 RepID=UPI002455741D|nr:hypothetical protein [Nocardia brasiliensis]